MAYSYCGNDKLLRGRARLENHWGVFGGTPLIASLNPGRDSKLVQSWKCTLDGNELSLILVTEPLLHQI